MMNDFEKLTIALIVLAIVAVVVGSKQTAAFVGTANGFLVAMIKKVNGSNG